MKKFLIKVNGNQYEVEVEEIRDGSTAAQTISSGTAAPAPAVSAPAASAPKPAAPAEKPAAPKTDTAPKGSTTINAPMPGTILSVNVNVGDKVKKGQVLLILEAMKMENEIMAPNDGTVASIHVSKGASVNAGDLLVSLA